MKKYINLALLLQPAQAKVPFKPLYLYDCLEYSKLKLLLIIFQILLW